MPRFARPDATRSVSRVSTTTAVQPSTTAWPTRRVLAKVPEITALFWVVKLLTTGMGEACSDWLAGGAAARHRQGWTESLERLEALLGT